MREDKQAELGLIFKWLNFILKNTSLSPASPHETLNKPAKISQSLPTFPWQPALPQLYNIISSCFRTDLFAFLISLLQGRFLICMVNKWISSEKDIRTWMLELLWIRAWGVTAIVPTHPSFTCICWVSWHLTIENSCWHPKEWNTTNCFSKSNLEIAFI